MDCKDMNLSMLETYIELDKFEYEFYNNVQQFLMLKEIKKDGSVKDIKNENNKQTNNYH